MIKQLILKNFRVFPHLSINFNDGLNVLVGDNEAGKSTVLEAINLALTSRFFGQHISVDLSEHLINRVARTKYVDDMQSGITAVLPEVMIELYLEESTLTAALMGTNNSLELNSPGVRLCASFNQEYATEYAEFIREPAKVTSVPIEYYKIEWRDFSGRSLNSRSLKITSSLIDASRIRLKSGADYYLQRIISRNLSDQQRVQLARSYRSQQESFANDPAIAEINTVLDTRKDEITSKRLTLEIDSSQSSAWENSLAPHLDHIPVTQAGSGEQNMLKILLALSPDSSDAHIVLIEEPENHLSFSSLNRLIKKIGEKCENRQIIISTHSSFVINKLGLDQLMLLGNHKVMRLNELSEDTQKYFKKLSGYDTLRLVLSKKVILVEGPSDELVVQRAYRDTHEGRRPIEDGVDVINVRGLSFKRFLEIADLLELNTVVVTDNDGNPSAVDEKYSQFDGRVHIKICRGDDPSLKTLEPQIAHVNPLTLMEEILGRLFATEDELVTFMTKSDNKTECALLIHDTLRTVTMPKYIRMAVGAE